MSRQPRRFPPHSSFPVFQDEPPKDNQYSATGSESNESEFSGVSTVPDHHRAVASTPHPYRNSDGRPKPCLRDMRKVDNDENIRRNTSSSRSGSSYSNTSVSSSTSMTGRDNGASSDSCPSASGSQSSYGSQYFYTNDKDNELVLAPTSPSHAYYYERENLRPAPYGTVPEPPSTPERRAHLKAYNRQQANNNMPVEATSLTSYPPTAPDGPEPPQNPARRTRLNAYPNQDSNDLGSMAEPVVIVPAFTPQSQPPMADRPVTSGGERREQQGPPSQRSGSRTNVSLVGPEQRPANTKVAVKLKSLRRIVREMEDLDDNLIIVMSVPPSALETRPRPRLPHRGPGRSQRSRRGERSTSRRKVNRNVPE